MRSPSVLLFACALTLVACGGRERSDGSADDRAGAPGQGAPKDAASKAPERSASAPPTSPTPPAAAAPARSEIRLIAGGDVCFGRMMGQELLRDPDREVFATVAPLFASADLRFVNLESQISDQGGVTGSTENTRIFVGPPAAARTLGRAGITVVSTANNHAWDYGKAALFETMDRLDAEGVRYVGSGRTRAEAYAPLVIEQGGFRVGFLAVTDIWNQGPLRDHVARELVAMADPEDLAASVRALKAQPGIDAVVVSYHGGSEYMEEPLQSTRRVLHAAVDAGADVVLGHHPHAVQGVGWYAGKPILYSLGNLIMGMHPEHPWSELGYLARVTLRRGAGALVEACPYRLHGRVPIPLAADPNRALTEQRFFPKLAAISRRVAGTAIGPVAPDGCAPLGPPAEPVAGAVP